MTVYSLNLGLFFLLIPHHDTLRTSKPRGVVSLVLSKLNKTKEKKTAHKENVCFILEN